MEDKTQLERIALQVEMLRLAKPVRVITDEEFQNIIIRADDLIRILNLEDADMWAMQKLRRLK